METEQKQLLQGIDTVIIRVTNIELSKAWYQYMLGLTPIWSDDRTKLIVLDTNGPTSITLWQTDQSPAPDKSTASFPIFKTPDAEALRQEIMSRGVKAEELTRDESVSYFFFYDPDGNLLEACQVHE